MKLARSGILQRVYAIERLTRLATALFLLALTAAGCSALELYQGNASATARAESASAAATEDPAIAALESALTAAQATQESLIAGAADSSATIAALEATPTSAPAATDHAPAIPASAETIVYGAVPIDSDRLNIIAALAFDAAGQLLAATRAGEVYRLRDADGRRAGGGDGADLRGRAGGAGTSVGHVPEGRQPAADPWRRAQPVARRRRRRPATRP